MKKLMALLTIAMASTAYSGTLAVPTAFEIDPYFATVCLHDKPATTAYVTGTDNGVLTGVASMQGYVCALKVHAGRGPGIRIFSACADVTWDLAGNILSVVPTANASAYSIVCE